MIADLYHCSRCGLTFVSNSAPKVCPACKRTNFVPTEISLAGKRVEVREVLVLGESVLADSAVQARLAAFDLGERCEHGFISPRLCNDCAS